MKKQVIIGSSLSPDNTWFCYREDGKEVKFTVDKKSIRSSIYRLTPDEMAYIKTHILNEDED
jgi:hypothetical protein